MEPLKVTLRRARETKNTVRYEEPAPASGVTGRSAAQVRSVTPAKTSASSSLAMLSTTTSGAG